MEILIDKGELHSGCCNVNFVARQDNIYVIDNHLVAFWCWHKLDLKSNYELIHIDQHYDLKKYSEKYKKIHNVNWTNSEIESLTDLKVEFERELIQVLRWDNYINLFKELHPNFFENIIFYTHKEDNFAYDGKYEENQIYELMGYINNKANAILNLDIDYFFMTFQGTTVQIYTDNYISQIGNWIFDNRKCFAQIIICLSPECCGSWKHSKKIANIILNKFSVNV